MKTIIAVAALTAISGAASAQDAAAPEVAPIQAVTERPATGSALPANTEVLLSMNEDLTTKGGRIEIGHKFDLTVVHDVRVDNAIVIPRGSPAVGEVTWKTGKGVFGKSGKMDIELRYVEVNGRSIPVTGKYRQEGEGNTLAAVGAVFLSAPLLFVTGKSAKIPRGRELVARTKDAIPVVMP